MSFQNILGCGDYDVWVVPRGGGTSPITNLPWESLHCERVLDDTSQADVVATADPHCCAALADVRPWEHELLIYRSNEELWTGPILGITYASSGQVKISARDISAWWDRRRIHNDHDYSVPTPAEEGAAVTPLGIGPVDLSVIFNDLIADAMAPDNTPGVVVVASPCGITGTQKFLASQHLILGPTVRTISQVGIDWTVIGRVILAGGEVVPTAPFGVLVDDNFVNPPELTLDGNSQTNDSVTRGAGGGEAGDTIFGQASDPGAAARDGLLEEVNTRSDLTDNISCDAASKSRLALATAPITITNCYLEEDTPVGAADLVPGSLVALELSDVCVPIAGIFRLNFVKFTVGQGTEQIEIGVQPTGTTT